MARDWLNCSPDVIFAEKENEDGIFNSHAPSYRHQLTLDELRDLPMEDELGHEIPIFSEDGVQIERRLACYSNRDPPLPGIFDLTSIAHHFTGTPADDSISYQFGIPGSNNPKLSIYPQAGLRSAGHFQADGLMDNFYPRIETINQLLREDWVDSDDDDDSDHNMHLNDNEPHTCPRFPIFGVASQGYNSVIHTTRGYGAQHHEAQQGLVTAALGGFFSCGADIRTERKWKHVKNSIHWDLPHEKFDQKISDLDLTHDLRLENVYAIDLFALKEGRRNGLYAS